jgi:hypothetical protein
VVSWGDSGGFKPDERPVGDGVTRRRDLVVEVVRGNVPQMSHRRSQQDRVIVEYSHQDQCEYRVFPGVENKYILLGLRRMYRW